MSKHVRPIVIAVIVGVALPVVAAASGQFGFLRKGKVDYQAFKDPGGRFSLEYPRDWQAIAGAGDVIASFSERKGEAALVIERFHLNQALASEEVSDLLAQLEADVLKEHQPKATDVKSQVVEAGGRRFIVIEYARPGLNGPERARQYSFPVQDEMFRLTCSAAVAQFTKYDPVFAHIADSFKPRSSNPTGVGVAGPDDRTGRAAQEPVRVGGDIQAPVKTKDVRPVYPAMALSSRVEGVVTIDATIGADGKVTDAKVVHSIPLLDQAALAAVRQWEFTPTLVKGVPVPVVMTVTVIFSLNARPPHGWSVLSGTVADRSTPPHQSW
jgi:TonB family protein